jgi:hypothetical protein
VYDFVVSWPLKETSREERISKQEVGRDWMMSCWNPEARDLDVLSSKRCCKGHFQKRGFTLPRVPSLNISFEDTRFIGSK